MSAIAALLLIAADAPAAPAVPAQAYPSAAVLENFAQTCGDLSSLAKAEAAARKAGWATQVPAKDAPVRQLLDFGMAAAKRMTESDPGFKTEERVMQANIGGRALDLMLTWVEQTGSTSLGCRIVDFAATTPIDDAALDAWLDTAFPKTEKGETAKLDGVMQVRSWQPGLFDGHSKSQVAFVPQDSPLKSSLHLSGVNLMSQTRN